MRSLLLRPWAKRSRGLFIDNEGNLVVAVSDAATGQELSMMKTGLAGKMRAAGRSLGVQVSGLRFDLKHFHGGVPGESGPEALAAAQLPTPSEADLDAIELSAEDCARLNELKESLSTAASGAGVAPER